MGSVDVEIQSNHSHIRNIVLIIGESLGRNHMSLYGYSLPTTPLLDSLYRQDELYRLSDVIYRICILLRQFRRSCLFLIMNQRGNGMTMQI